MPWLFSHCLGCWLSFDMHGVMFLQFFGFDVIGGHWRSLGVIGFCRGSVDPNYRSGKHGNLLARRFS